MKQSAEQRPIPSVQRKAAIALGAALDHSGDVAVAPIPDFDLDRTIFQTLEKAAPRYVIKTRIAKTTAWDRPKAESVEAAYQAARTQYPLPTVDPALLRFMVDECDFDVEHADGSFLDHLYFCFEYGVQHYPERSPLVLLLHSILGTGTNTFAMSADKIPTLRGLMNEFEWRHTEAFPSVLRLLYDLPLRKELWANVERLDQLESIRMHRVIDNEPITLSAEDFFVQLNYQLIHLVDFLPVANWSTHQNDTSFIVFRDLYDLLQKAGKLEAKIDYEPAKPNKKQREAHTFGGWLTTLIPVRVSETMAAKSVRRFSERVGHSMEYTLTFK
ncbi:MAG: hypothetical protein R3B40_02265 [Polyangiales bacterium]|nr:hypothetical protein [Myxococcales bacterium]MCB9657104.1 hypothetical protein [Sandaracinaceae bacterium]